MERGSGILLPIFSLPSRHGIGTAGREALAFVDFLHDAEQSFWQVLPLGPTGFGDSPYQSPSAFAGNPYFIDIDTLADEGLITEAEAAAFDGSDDPRYVDYGRLYASRFKLLAIAKRRGYMRDLDKIRRFERENSHWLGDYALFMALKRHFGMRAWPEWEDEAAREHRPEALKEYSRILREDVELFTYIQYLFYTQWERLKSYAHSRRIRIIGDLPIYSAMDSADVWANRDLFMLDADGRPTETAGVPPDYFSADGQLWGNPLYRWDRMAADGYSWWLARIAGASRLYDVIRIDHFRGFESYWAVAAGASTAREGRWRKGPGAAIIDAIKAAFPRLGIIAEDLGLLTPEVNALLEYSGFPGMKVLEFAFDADGQSSYLPHNYEKNCVCFTGTHDNAPLALWFEEADARDAAFAKKYLALSDDEGLNWGMIRGGMASAASLFIAQMQDYLGLGAGHRLNTPGTSVGNWRWRMLPGEADAALAARIAEYTRMYGRQRRPDTAP